MFFVLLFLVYVFHFFWIYFFFYFSYRVVGLNLIFDFSHFNFLFFPFFVFYYWIVCFISHTYTNHFYRRYSRTFYLFINVKKNKLIEKETKLKKRLHLNVKVHFKIIQVNKEFFLYIYDNTMNCVVFLLNFCLLFL